MKEGRRVIPWRVGLHQCPPPVHRLCSQCTTVVLPVEEVAANGEQCLIWLSQPRGQHQRPPTKDSEATDVTLGNDTLGPQPRYTPRTA
jgi:hypothetical protein